MNKFRIKGIISRTPNITAKVALFTVEVTGDRGKSYLDVKSFSPEVMRQAEGLQDGDEVTVDGELMSEPMYANKAPVTDQRGKAIWGIGLKATSIVVSGGERKPTRVAKPAAQADDTEVPF